MLVARDDEVNAGLPGDVLNRDGDSGAVLMAGIWESPIISGESPYKTYISGDSIWIPLFLGTPLLCWDGDSGI